MASHRTPLARVLGLGSAREGTGHFWKQRVTAVSNIVLVSFLIYIVAKLAGHDHASVRAALAHPLYAIPILLLVISGTIHMRLGMQTIIEDYVHSEGPKVLALMLNTFFAIAVGLTSVFAVLKLSIGS
jgi:succinate dehydrogenase / fumarate reductase membrane anchor subunit